MTKINIMIKGNKKSAIQELSNTSNIVSLSKKDEHFVEQIGLMENNLNDKKTDSNQISKSNAHLNITSKNYLDPDECRQNDNEDLKIKT